MSAEQGQEGGRGSEAITELLRAAEGGDRAALDEVFGVVYAELRKLARRQLQVTPVQHTLSTTALVHEAYLKLSVDARWSTRDRSHFFALAARAMRHILIDHARRRTRRKRGGPEAPLSLEDAQVPVHDRGEELLALDQALERLAAVDPELARLVEWRFFAGLSVEEVAQILEVSDRTVKRQWRAARAFLYQQLGAPGAGA
jgi:RNA polymerase sigma factor (TIGR02999 family)